MPHKRKAIWTTALVLIMLCVFYFSTPVFAEQEASYSITDYTSDITLHPDGSVYFDEKITYRLLQESVEIIKPIPMANSSMVEDMEVFKLQPEGSEASEADPELKPVKQVSASAGNNGESYLYELMDTEEYIYNITIPFEGRKQEEITFVYRYRMMDTVFLYNDTAVFSWSYLLPPQMNDVRNIKIQIALPEIIPVEEWNGYIKGTAHAQKELLEEGIFSINVETLKEGEYLESILLLPNSLFPDGRKVIDNDAEEEIISDMTAWEDQASRIRREGELRLFGSWALGLVAILLCIGTGLLLYLKPGIRKAVFAQTDKLDEMPDTSMSPAELGALMKGGKAGAREFFATVLSLIQSRYMELQHRENGEGFLVLREDMEKYGLKPHEEYVLNLLGANLSGGRVLPLINLEQMLNDYGRRHRDKTSKWEGLVNQRSAKRNFGKIFFEINPWAIGAVFISLLAAVIAWLAMDNPWAGLLTGVCALALAGYVIMMNKPNEDNKDFQTKWQRYGEELLAKLDDQDNLLPLNEWEEEIVFAVPLGIGGKILDKLPQIYKESAFEDGNLTILYRNNISWLARTLENLK